MVGQFFAYVTWAKLSTRLLWLQSKVRGRFRKILWSSQNIWNLPQNFFSISRIIFFLKVGQNDFRFKVRLFLCYWVLTIIFAGTSIFFHVIYTQFLQKPDIFSSFTYPQGATLCKSQYIYHNSKLLALVVYFADPV